MTIIAAKKTPNGVIMSADRAVTSGGNVRELAHSKIIRRNWHPHDYMLIGCTGSLRFINLVHNNFFTPFVEIFRVEKDILELHFTNIDGQPEQVFIQDDPVTTYVQNVFVPHLMAMLTNTNFMRSDTGEHPDERSSTLLLGIGRRIFSIHCDFTVKETTEDFRAIGSGQEFALGAAYILEGSGYSDELFIEYAVSAAIALDSSCDGKIDTLTNYELSGE